MLTNGSGNFVLPVWPPGYSLVQESNLGMQIVSAKNRPVGEIGISLATSAVSAASLNVATFTEPFKAEYEAMVPAACRNRVESIAIIYVPE